MTGNSEWLDLAWPGADAGPPVPVRVRLLRLAPRSSHAVAVVEVEDGSGRRLILKGKRKHQRITQSLERECQLLTDVAPKIRVANPLLRAPRPVAYYPERPLLALEMVDGPSLHTLLFSARRQRRLVGIPRLLAECGEWITRFHELTRLERSGNPFDVIDQTLRRPFRHSIFDRYGGPVLYAEVMNLIEQVRDRFREVRQPVTLVHGEFTPYHVLVADGAIYVIDFGRTHEGYPFEDLSLFLSTYDVLLPWRVVAGRLRLGLEEQRRAFLAAAPDSTLPCDARGSLMALGRIHAMVGRLTHLETRGTPRSWRRRAYIAIARTWLPHRFRHVCRGEIARLRRLLSMTT